MIGKLSWSYIIEKFVTTKLGVAVSGIDVDITDDKPWYLVESSGNRESSYLNDF